MGLAAETKALKVLHDHGFNEDQLLLFVEVGSSAHGIVSSSEDTDYTGVFMQTFDQLVNTCNESLMLRTALEGQRSGANDIDINLYSLRRFAHLARNGNPSILTAMFSEKRAIHGTVDWNELADLVRSKRVGFAFLGYMNEQLRRWEGKASKRVNRPELVEAHGYDTKYASHVIRLGLQGIEYMKEGRFSVPMDRDQADYLTAIRSGEVPEPEVKDLAMRQMRMLEILLEQSDFPEKGRRIDEWLTDNYYRLLQS